LTRFDRNQALAWLTSRQVLADDGVVRSWANPQHPGFAYPEAAALWLGWASWRVGRNEPAPTGDQVRGVAHRLAAELAAGRGLGQDGRAYLFDTCVALHALARASACGLTSAIPDAGRVGAAAAIERFLDEDAPVLPPATETASWSTAWGPYQARGAGLLAEAGVRLRDPRLSDLAQRIRQRIRAVADQGARRYVHAWLYGLEGELIRGEAAQAVALPARALATLQREDGGLPAWSDAPGPPRSDSTAQAIRVWSAVDRAAFDVPIGRALRFLASLQDDSGGVAYEPGSKDRTTWSAIFADQAAAWSGTGLEPGGWI